MTTELDELAARAMNDTSLSSGLGEVIKSVIDRTRRHWATMSDEHVALDAGTACPESRRATRP